MYLLTQDPEIESQKKLGIRTGNVIANWDGWYNVVYNMNWCYEWELKHCIDSNHKRYAARICVFMYVVLWWVIL